MTKLKDMDSKELRSLGTMLIIIGFIACITIIGIIAGIPMIFFGIYVISLGNKKQQTEQNQVRKENITAVQEQTAKLDAIANNNKAMSTADEIAKFADLKAKGIITDEEFEATKKKLIG
jgi:predicted membrane protein